MGGLGRLLVGDVGGLMMRRAWLGGERVVS